VQDGPTGPEPRGGFDDAGFLLLPGDAKTLIYNPAPGEQAMSPEDFARLIVCRHL